MDDDFHSLNKGVFVIPFRGRPGPEHAGPSTPRPRPLAKVYDTAYRKYEQACEAFEADRTAEQLDDIDAWLERCDEPAAPRLAQAFPIVRLPIALVQDLSPSVDSELPSLHARAISVNGRDVGDIAAATRLVAVGFVGEAALAAKKAGRTPIDEVERWWRKTRERRPLLIHIQQAQLIPSMILSELIYILTLHNAVPFRLLLSVPSISHFLTAWTLLEPSEVDLRILSSRAGRDTAVKAVLKAASDTSIAPITITPEVVQDLERQEALFGEGSAGVLKALKWLLLNHSFESPLGEIGDGDLAHLQTIVDGIRSGQDVPGRDMFKIRPNPDLATVLNPAPRLSVLQAMAAPHLFLNDNNKEDSEGDDKDATPRASRRASGPTHTSPHETETHDTHEGFGRTDTHSHPYKEVEALYSLWQSAGKSVNLWDWLEGFEAVMTDEGDEGTGAGEGTEAWAGDKRKRVDGPETPRKRHREDEDGARDDVDADVDRHGDRDGNGNIDDDNNNDINGNDTPAVSEETKQRLHATFIRFVEEARTLGLVRARGGRSKRGDEVAKAVMLV